MQIDQSSMSCAISDVERDTGLAKETLRVWERRYDFPQPLRNAFGERVYPLEQVAKLRLMTRLIDLGFRPGKIVHFNSAQLQALTEQTIGLASPDKPVPATHPELPSYLVMCKKHQIYALRVQLSEALLTMGVTRFVIELIGPLIKLVGEAWASGHLAIFEEHLFTESVQMVLRNAIFSMSQHISAGSGAGQPRILLTTLPQERHGLGLLMVEALCVNEGAYCMSLGVQTPLPDIVEAARLQRADIVALSFSSAVNPRHASDALLELRARLPQTSEIWAGGSSSALHKTVPARVLDLTQLSSAVKDWRQRQAQLC